MASLEEDDINGGPCRSPQIWLATSIASSTVSLVTLETLATSNALARGDYAAFHQQATSCAQARQSGNPADRPQLSTTAQYTSADRLHAATDFRSRDGATGVRHKQRQVSGLFMGVVSRQPIINVWVPVFEGDVVRYAMGMALDATRFESLLQGQRLEAQWITGVTDNKGIILARSERHAEFVGKPLPKELLEQQPSGERRVPRYQRGGAGILRATVRSKIAGWLVSATVAGVIRRGVAQARAMVRHGDGRHGVRAGCSDLPTCSAGSWRAPLDAATAAAAAVGTGQTRRTPEVAAASKPIR